MTGSANDEKKVMVDESNRSQRIMAEEPEGDTYGQKDNDDDDDENNS
jgi:hypothetical protein